MTHDPLLDALDNALDNIELGNHEATSASLKVAQKHMREKNPVEFDNAKRIFDSFFSSTDV